MENKTTINTNKIFNYLHTHGYASNGFDAHLITNNAGKVYYEDQGGKIIIFCTSNSIFFECVEFDGNGISDILRECFDSFESWKDYFETNFQIED